MSIEKLVHIGDDSLFDEVKLSLVMDDFNYLLGKILTIVEASTTDPGQRKALKDVIRQTFFETMNSRMSVSGRVPSTVRSGLASLKSLVEQEKEWCKTHELPSDIERDYKAGFIAGLDQTLMFINKIKKA